MTDTFSETSGQALMPDHIKTQLTMLDPNNRRDQILLYKFVCDALSDEADHHGTAFIQNAYPNVVDAMDKDKILKCFVLDVSYNKRPAEEVGIAMVAPSVYTVWNKEEKRFRTFPSIYVEDTYIVKDESSRFYTALRNAKAPRAYGLGEHITAELIKQATSGGTDGLFERSAAAYQCEYGSQNTKILSVFDKLYDARNKPSTDNNLHVLGYGQDSSDLRNGKKVELVSLSSYPHILEHAFGTTWSKTRGGSLRVHVDFVETISTFRGQKVVRAFVTDNGEETEPKELSCVYSSLFYAAAHEVLTRGWVPNAANIRDVLNNTYIHITPTGDARRNAIRSDAFRKIGFHMRKLGTCDMKPHCMEMGQMDKSAINTHPSPPIQYDRFKTRWNHPNQPYSQPARTRTGAAHATHA